MVETLTIKGIGHRGDGIAEGPGEPLYVSYTLPGESVIAEPWPGHPDRRQLLRIDAPSPERITPICPHFGVCGGCALQHWRFDRYAAWKRDLVVETLAQAKLDAPVGPLCDAHGEGRRRMVLHARRSQRDVLQVGFAAPRAHHIVPIDHCPILAPALTQGIEIAWKLAEAVQAVQKPLDIHVTATDAGLDVDLRGSGALSPRLQSTLTQLAATLRLARLTRHGELIAQREPPTLVMGRARVALPPGSFLQATAAGEAELARRVLAHAAGARHVADLFCGVGPFALRLAETARVSAFDNDAAAVAALQRAAQTTPGLKPIAATTRDLFRRPLQPAELAAFDAVVFDPPRQGAEAQARLMATAKVPRIIAVSCNPATFVRDARLLVDGGYRLVEVAPVDQFRYSPHVELVALLTR